MEAPTREKMWSVLSKALAIPDLRVAWLQACESAGVTDQPSLSPQALLQVMEEISRRGGVVQILARSQIMRIKTYLFFSAQQRAGVP